MQQAGAADAPPPVDGVLAHLMLVCFVFVMLGLPWLLARDAAGSTSAADGPVAKPSSERSLFSSERERRLWVWTAVALAAIYLTLSPAQELAGALRERGLLGPASGAFLLAVAMLVAREWARTGPGRREIGAGLGIATVYLTTLIRLPVPEARSHLYEYGLVAMLVHQALEERRRNGREVPLPAVLAVIVTALLGWIDEVIQYFLPDRIYDLLDVGFNALAALMAVTASGFVSWARRWDVLARLGSRGS